jgi:hypothetical protein
MNDIAMHCRYQVADAGGLDRCKISALNHPDLAQPRRRRPPELVAQRLAAPA